MRTKWDEDRHGGVDPGLYNKKYTVVGLRINRLVGRFLALQVVQLQSCFDFTSSLCFIE